MKRSTVSPLIYIASLVAFLLPFFSVSCGGRKVATFTGVQLAVGTTLDEPQMFGPAKKQSINPDPFAAAAALCALAGIVLSVTTAKAARGAAIAGGAGAVSLLVMESRMNDQIASQGQGMLQISVESGFSLALVLLVAGAAWNVYVSYQQKRGAIGPAPAVSPPMIQEHTALNSLPVVDLKFCAGCGTPIKPGGQFCENCGKPVAVLSAASPSA